MYLFTKLSKRSKTISWFLVHVFIIQVIPFSAFANQERIQTVSNRTGNLAISHRTGKSNPAAALPGLSAAVSLQNKAAAESGRVSAAPELFREQANSAQLKAVTASGGGFSPGSMNDMVDPFTGDFSYSIPLMDVEGYPLTLSYNSNISMNTEATWVGLGWNLDVGSVSREMRGIPDEFNGDQSLTTIYKVKNDETTDGFKAGPYVVVGTSIGGQNFLSPKVQVTALWGNYRNSYLGLGKTFDIGLQSSISLSYSNEIGNVGFKYGLGYSSDTKGGVGFNSSYGFSAGIAKRNRDVGPNASISYTFGNNFNSRSGLIAKNQSFSVSAGYTTSKDSPNSVDKNGKLLKRDGHSGSGHSASYGASTSVTYGTATAIPRLRTNNISESNAFLTDLYVGLGFKWGYTKVGGIFETYETSTKMAGNSSLYSQPAYGYLHTGKRANEKRSYAVMDFDRGADFRFSERMRNLPFSVQSFDIFHVSSSGLNAQFRANRTDVGTYYDASTNAQLNQGSEILFDDDMKGVNAGVFFGAGITIEVGYSSGTQQGEMKTGRWGSPLSFPAVAPGKSFDPTTYFKAIGELTPNDVSNYAALGGIAATQFNLAKTGSDIDVTNTLSNGSTISSLSGTVPTRATAFQAKTALEMWSSTKNYDREFSYYNRFGTYVSEDRTGGRKAGNHISAIKVISTGGGQYTYGIPNYSLVSSDVSFSISNTGGRTYDETRGETTYHPTDAGTSNFLGKSQMYDQTDVPAYASSFLLTSIVGSDYIDMTDDGPTWDDIGSYHKFDYVNQYDSASPYKWRFPVSGYGGSSDPKAILNKGYLSLSTDDIATYSYSEREVYYPKTITGKNYIAVFVLGDRKDAYGVTGVTGFLDDTKPLKYLDKIILYNLNDYKQNPANAVPLQVVDFEYDYSLCLKSPNNLETYTNPSSSDNGKLTLKKIITYSGTSKEMGLSAMEFTYNNGPSYNHLNIDRWGNYKLNDANLPNNLYPYSIQDETLANTNAAVWKLSKISTPSGGEMLISYQADSYGYVQNKRAMRHFKIEGMINVFQYYSIMNQTNWNMSDPALALSNEFRKDNWNPDLALIAGQYMDKYGKFEENFVPNNIIVFKLDSPIDASIAKNTANKLVKDRYFKDPSAGPNAYLKQLYFNIYARVKTADSEELDEIIPCFVDIAADYPELFQVWGGSVDNNLVSIGVMPPPTGSVSYEYGYVVLDPVNVGMIEETKKKEKKDKDILLMHPIQRFGVDFIRQNLPDIVYGACETCDGELAVDKKALFGKEMYKYIIDQGGYLRSLTPGRSFVRLFEPDNKKMGGNARVGTIQVNDKWAGMSGEGIETDGTYYWGYTYPSRDQSLGVAAYEPSIGMDENPFYRWHSYYNFAKKFPDELNFNVTPLAQQLFPDAVVGYEQVRVSMSGLNASFKGEVVMNFHTNKEDKYATLALSSGLDRCDPVKEKSFFTGKTVDKYGFTQGYSVTTSDFHGKLVDMTLNDINGKPISKTEYTYYEPGEKIPMIDRKGMVTNESVAQEFDIHLDSRFVYDESRFQMAGLTVGFNYPQFKVSFSPYYTQSSRERGFYSLCLMKHMNYSAVIKSIKTSYLGSDNTANNLLYDKYSGEVVLSSLQDEYNDRLYSLAYPSHWAYPNLREVQASYPASSSGTINSADGLLTTTFNLGEFYAPGDLIELTSGSSTSQGYILSIASTGLTAYIVKPDGVPFTLFSGAITFKMKVPNRNNRLSETMQSVVTKKPFAVTPGTEFAFPTNNSSDEILSSSAITYKDKNNIFQCAPKEENTFLNLFANGAKGDPVVETGLSWQSERKNEVSAHKTRFDGAYLDFKPFYAMDANDVWTRIDKSNYPYAGNGTLQKWRKNEIPTRFDQFGNPLEMRDALGIYSAVAAVSNNKVVSLPVAQAVNANTTDIAFDGFEAYSYGSTEYTYFAFPVLNIATSLSSTVRHSGKTSLKLPASQSMQYATTVVSNCPFEEMQNTDLPGNYPAGSSCKCPVPVFNPNPGEYIFGAWVKQSATGATVKVIVGSGGSAITYTAVKSGPVIEGWQRVEGTCTIPAGPIAVSLKLENSSASDAYFDDFRFHPFTAGMTTIVYDPVTFLPLATHDGYNYTTFYNYDENLQLVRVKVETTEGIKTVSETEFGLSTK